jgi:hypothetical protein
MIPANRQAIGKGEREDLQRLVRQRERVLKSSARQRSAELISDFESQMAAQYSFDQDETWREARQRAQREVEKAQKQIAARCAELGIPARFAPTIEMAWYRRGENSVKERRDELRRVAQAQVAAIERRAFVEIETSCLDAQTKLAIAGCTSDMARTFVESLPAVDTLMPRLSYAAIAGEADPPVVEQLLMPNALRQRRFRERRRPLQVGARSVTDVASNAAVTPPDDEADGAP